MRLVDADALKRKAQKLSTEAWKINRVAKVTTILNQFIDWIDGMPTIDAVEVVRCKDCKYRSEDGECDCNSLHMQMEGDSIGVGFVPEKDFYCSYGERREDGEE